MGAICGIWYLGGKSVDISDIQSMLDKQLHYGRDMQDYYIAPSIGIGCCLSNISMLSEKSVPLCRDEKDEIILAADAIIYNREELLKELAIADDLSDNELLLLAYKRWGVNSPLHINGDFAIAVWEANNERLVLIRDHLGVRPLYYYYYDNTLVFATDYQAILQLPFVNRQLDEIILYRALSNQGCLESERTDFDKIKRLQQAHYVTITKKGIDKHKYWTPGSTKIKYDTEQEYFNKVYEVVSDAVKLRFTRFRCNIGAELSGGLDSSVITVIVNREMAKQNKKLYLCSWSPSLELQERQTKDERSLIELLCQQEGFECEYLMNESFIDSLDMLDIELKTLAKKNINIMFSGWGGDQGISHRANMFELLAHGEIRHYLREAKFLAKGSVLRFAKIILSNSIIKYYKLHKGFKWKEGINIGYINPIFNKRIIKECKKSKYYFSLNPVKHIESGNIQTRTEISAIKSAKYNVQYVFPFLDYRVVDLAMSVPRNIYYKKGINRYAYRNAFKDILPDKLCYYTDKDDYGKSSYMKNHPEAREQRLEENLAKLNRSMFVEYVDFDKLIQVLDNIPKTDREKYIRFYSKMLMTLYQLQESLD